MQLNNEKKAAVSHTTGPALVIAGAGSGKTAVITHRVKNLIEECAVKPSEILTITFTKSAAIEMQRRFLRLTESSYQGSVFGTFQRMCEFFNERLNIQMNRYPLYLKHFLFTKIIIRTLIYPKSFLYRMTGILAGFSIDMRKYERSIFILILMISYRIA